MGCERVVLSSVCLGSSFWIKWATRREGGTREGSQRVKPIVRLVDDGLRLQEDVG